MALVIGRDEMYPSSKPMKKSDVIKTTVKDVMDGKDPFSHRATMGKNQVQSTAKPYGRMSE